MVCCIIISIAFDTAVKAAAALFWKYIISDQLFTCLSGICMYLMYVQTLPCAYLPTRAKATQYCSVLLALVLILISVCVRGQARDLGGAVSSLS